jgi:hypothetical protein
VKDWAAQENAGDAFEILVIAESIVGVIIIASAIFIVFFWRKQKLKHKAKYDDE